MGKDLRDEWPVWSHDGKQIIFSSNRSGVASVSLPRIHVMLTRMSPQTLQDAANRLTALFASKPEVLAVYIFGSLATGKARPNSDIDVAVLLDPAALKSAPPLYRADLNAAAGAALETFNVDVVILNEAPPALAHNVITKGKLIFERSRSARIAFQVRNLNRFLDLEPMHRVQIDYMKKRYN